MTRLSAPGKLMICGEYVVLDGAEALIAAVDARVVAVTAPAEAVPEQPGTPTVEANIATVPPEAALARKEAEKDLGPAAMRLTIDTSALSQGRRKLGLGSSAAATAVSAAAVLEWHGGDPARERRRVLHWALAGHRAVAPHGSGADVAASTLGGLVRFRRDAVEAAQVLVWPRSIHVVVVWTGQPARTSDFVSAVRALAADRPQRYRQASAPLRMAAEAMLAAVVAGDAGEAVRLAAEHGRAMAGLGEAAGVPIVTPSLQRVVDLARKYGGGAKPSGAGGGDVAVAFFDEPVRAARFGAGCDSAGLTRLPLALGVEGVRVEAPPRTDPEPKERG